MKDIVAHGSPVASDMSDAKLSYSKYVIIFGNGFTILYIFTFVLCYGKASVC